MYRKISQRGVFGWMHVLNTFVNILDYFNNEIFGFDDIDMNFK